MVLIVKINKRKKHKQFLSSLKLLITFYLALYKVYKTDE